ncbi:MAG: hypothetical protein ACE367_02070 [Acidimicrobiales bacterium]
MPSIIRQPPGADVRIHAAFDAAVIAHLEQYGHAIVDATEMLDLRDARADFERLASAFAEPDQYNERDRHALVDTHLRHDLASFRLMRGQLDALTASIARAHPDAGRVGAGTFASSMQRTEPGGSTRLHRDADDIIHVAMATQVSGEDAVVEFWRPDLEYRPPHGPPDFAYRTGTGSTVVIRNTWPWPLEPAADGGVFHRVTYPQSAGSPRQVTTIARRLSLAETLAVHLRRDRLAEGGDPDPVRIV